MYFASVLLLLLIFPLASIAVEAIRLGHSITDMSLIGEWFVFWAVGIRLSIVGLRQVFQPSFTAVEIFEIHEPKAFAIVRELGFANLSMGLRGLGSLWHKESLIPAAIVGRLILRPGRTGTRPPSAQERQRIYRDDIRRFRIPGAVGVHSIAV